SGDRCARSAWPLPSRRPTGPGRRTLPARLPLALRPHGAGSAARFHPFGIVRTINAPGRSCALVAVLSTIGRLLHVSAAGTNPDIARRNHGGNGVLVDHLAHGAAQQHHELVDGFDRTLQLDPVDQVDRDRYALATQGVQERVLQRLPLGHLAPLYPFVLVVGLGGGPTDLPGPQAMLHKPARSVRRRTAGEH